jgi:hypothetical protein
MQTVNFNCSFCDKMMAVGLNLLGRNVRCPHCKKVVQAPAGAVAAPPAPKQRTPPLDLKSFQSPTKLVTSKESIFSETSNDSMFERQQSEFSRPDDVQPPILPESRAPTNEAPADYDPGVNEAFGNPFALNNAATAEKSPSGKGGPELDGAMPLGREQPPPEALREGGGSSVFIWMLLVYSVISTGIAAYLFYERTVTGEKNESKDSGPYLSIPDFFGQYDRAERKKIAKITGMPGDQLPIPANLQVKLNETRRIRDLEVTPLAVGFRQVTHFTKYPGRDPVPNATNPQINLFLLRLKVKNLSQDVYFCPTDPAFSRSKESEPRDVLPYTGLVIGNDVRPGGPFLWPDPERIQEKRFEYEFIEGQENDGKPLAPNEERTVVIGAEMDVASIKNSIANNKDARCLWRVQLRRGLDTVKDRSGNDRDVSVSSVISVVFDVAEIDK